MTGLSTVCEPAPPAAGRIVVKPLSPGDAETVLCVFEGLGPRSRELRFLTAKPRLTGRDLSALTDVDGHDRVALVARRDGRPIGIARLVRDDSDPASADVAIAVVDAWQDRWVGTRLAHALADRAQELGITRFTIEMAQDNEPARRLLHRVADQVTRIGIGNGSVEYVATAQPAARRQRRVS